MSKKNNKNISSTDDIFTLGSDGGFLVNEAYKRLRTNIMFSFPEDNEKCKVIGITSSVSGEDKTTSALNLAHSIAMTGKKVIILECDLRKPTFASKLKIDKTKGLSNLLVGEFNSIPEVTNKFEHEGSSFDIMFSGDLPPNPSELLASSRMSKMLGVMSANYEYIILDLPPVSAVSDPIVVSRFTDGMIIAVKNKLTNKNLLRETLRQLKLANAKILGFVYTGADLNANIYGKRYKNYRKYSTYEYKSEK